LSVITGGVTSLTVTVKLQLVVLPAASVAVAVTVVVPTGKTEPEAGLLTIVGAEQFFLTEGRWAHAHSFAASRGAQLKALRRSVVRFRAGFR
jgi:hypothetical protein